MHALKFQTRITPDHRIELQLPVDTPIADAEVILLIDDSPRKPLSVAASDTGGSLLDLLSGYVGTVEGKPGHAFGPPDTGE